MGAMSLFWNQLLSVSFTSLKSEIRKWRDHPKLTQGQKEYVGHNWDVKRHGWTWDFIRALSLSHLVLALFSSAMVLFSGWLNLVKRMTFTMPIMTAQLEMLKSSDNVLGRLPISLVGAGAHSWEGGTSLKWITWTEEDSYGMGVGWVLQNNEMLGRKKLCLLLTCYSVWSTDKQHQHHLGVARNAVSCFPPQSHGIRICILTRSQVIPVSSAV